MSEFVAYTPEELESVARGQQIAVDLGIGHEIAGHPGTAVLRDPMRGALQADRFEPAGFARAVTDLLADRQAPSPLESELL